MAWLLSLVPCLLPSEIPLSKGQRLDCCVLSTCGLKLLSWSVITLPDLRWVGGMVTVIWY